MNDLQLLTNLVIAVKKLIINGSCFIYFKYIFVTHLQKV